MDGEAWTLVTILGPILLAAVVIWALLKNRKAGGRAETERATHDLYKAENADDKAAEDKVQR